MSAATSSAAGSSAAATNPLSAARARLVSRLATDFVTIGQLCTSVPPSGKPTAAQKLAVDAAIAEYAAAAHTLGATAFSFAPGAPATTMSALVAQGAQALAPCDPGAAQALRAVATA